MFVFDLLFAFLIAVVLASLLSVDYRRRGYARAGTWPIFWVVFLPVLLVVWAASLWLAPVGPVLWNVYWLPALVVGVIAALLIAALAPPPRTRSSAQPPEEARRERDFGLAIGSFFWLALSVLIAAILVGYWVP